MITTEQVVQYIHHPLPYEHGLVFVIDQHGRQIRLMAASELYQHGTVTIKVEGMERFSKQLWDGAQDLAFKNGHDGPITCHAFLADVNSPTFDFHTDPDDVIIYCCEGTKTIVVEQKMHVLNPGQSIFIPRNTVHKAVNHHPSLMLSFGLERYYNDKLVNL